jgi:hypothetical protein
MRFFLDEDLPPTAAVVARSFGVDIVRAHESGRRGLPDDVQLALAAQDIRCLVTRNVRDFERLTLEFQDAGYAHAGVLFVTTSLPNRRYAAIAEAVVRYNQEHPDGLPPYMTDYLHPV